MKEIGKKFLLVLFFLSCFFAKKAKRGHRYENPKCIIKRGAIVRKKWSKKK